MEEDVRSIDMKEIKNYEIAEVTITSGEGRIIQERNNALMSQVRGLLIENGEELRQKVQIIAELETKLRSKITVADRLTASNQKNSIDRENK